MYMEFEYVTEKFVLVTLKINKQYPRVIMQYNDEYQYWYGELYIMPDAHDVPRDVDLWNTSQLLPDVIAKFLEYRDSLKSVYASPMPSLYENVEENRVQLLKPYIEHMTSIMHELRGEHLVRTANAGYVYIMHAPNMSCYKIGYSKRPQQRLSTLGVKLPAPLELIHTIATNNMPQAESELHQRYSERRLNGEWFELLPDEVEEIKAIEAMNYE